MKISIIIPCYNEAKTIHLLLDALSSQSIPSEEFEILIADGMSTDGTRAVIDQYGRDHTGLTIRVLDNPAREIPSGLNVALAHAIGEYIVRLDAHSVPERDYLERSISNLKAGLGDNVGGLWLIHPGADTWIARSIAAAASHPFGVGDAKYRYSSQAGAVDTVPFGAFRRDFLQQLGGYDASLKTNEDYELNTRIRAAGGTVYFDPAIRTIYYARPTLSALWKQYWRYGFWKLQMLKRYPRSLRLRQLLPPLMVISMFGLLILSPFIQIAQILLGLEIGLYLVIMIATAFLQAVRKKQYWLVIGLPLAIGTMHFAWGTGFLWSFSKSLLGHTQ
ncbi:MAG: glycosyltransferase family 2 protein [Anaerolineaceae bacterium]|nr:glycosyltransferase family 2 protein [Anaerolineaceae bacterium]